MRSFIFAVLFFASLGLAKAESDTRRENINA